ncbi:MAG: DNA translocase FtsK [Ignavibacteria bacterium]|nr:DNA translocase FtsK [Ignavibacteria bacterium]MBK6418405.1 DNA translocase FtsK [Ignavibacteria bacterium]MBK7186766.1 DNA translocase FtsK [Ignavibacteria bacterium]MBK7412225.1 DNA translocase FtsK [Ignavibacteria bacterium]MBK7577721.1 DNA translocase FtsK [Ignavibacteria bacterium]
MAPRPDNIPLRRRNTTDAGSPAPEEASRPQQRTLQDEHDRIRRFKIVSVLIGLLAILMLIALVSYTQRDEANAQLTMRDMIGVIRGDDALRVRFETTYNWLGLLGAVVAHWMYTSTVGIWSIAIPVLMLFWAWDLFRFQRITPLLTRRSIATFSVIVTLSAFLGTMQLVELTNWLPRESCGAIGQFLAGVTTQFIGRVGSAIVWIVALGFVSVFGFEIDLSSLGLKTKGLLGKIEWRRSNRNNSSLDSARDDGYDENDGYDLEDEDENEVETEPTIVPPIRRRIQRPVLDVDDVDEEPATILPRPKPETLRTESSIPAEGKQLSSSVKILRPTKNDAPREVPPEPSPADEEPPSVDLTDLQKRLQELHPKKDISLFEESDGSLDSARDDASLDSARDDASLDPPFGRTGSALDDTPLDSARDDVSSIVKRPLVVTVQDTLFPVEPEMQLSNATLYDEEIAYKPPTIGLLVDVKDEAAVDDKELEANARTLQEKLETFRVRIENLTVTPGPVVTQYEFVPASGIKVSQIESLADDIALALKAQGVRIIAPIPGKGTVGIEIPNQHPSIVRFSSIIKSPKYHNPDIKLPLAMGKTVIGEVFCADLTKMPHLLIAGATGKGKSVGINTIIASLLYRMHPRDLKFVIIDPKRVEMNLYAALRDHFLAISPDIDETIVTSPQNAVTVLKALVEEMQQRFSILAAAGQRNISDYNQKVRDGKIKDKGGIRHRPMPFIVVIIDELADLMMTASKEVEEPICRLAQLARAVGIHCIVATQRPSVDVVTGLIKANFPARIAYQCSSRIDSRTILDGTGAEHLIGNGDMLFAPGNTPIPIRMQNAFISTEETEALCEWIGGQKGYSTPYMLPSVNKRGGGMGGGSSDRDALFEDAARIFIQLQQASTSTLQRRLKVGYARAARIVDELEMAGIVGPPDGSRGRPVLLQSESELEAYL